VLTWLSSGRQNATEIKAIQSTAAIEIGVRELAEMSHESICIDDARGDRNSYLSRIR
jgi:hypothetical protein